jgi:hypothetical protein
MNVRVSSETRGSLIRWALVHKSGHGNSSATSRDFSGTNRERFGPSESGHPVEDVAGDDRLRLL